MKACWRDSRGSVIAGDKRLDCTKEEGKREVEKNKKKK